MTNSQNEIWEQVKEFYKTKFGFEPHIVDLIVDLDILMMCARGASNSSILNFFKMSEETEYWTPITNAIDKYFGFSGWKEDLPFNPKRIYDGLDTKDVESFISVVVVQYGFTDPIILDRAYDVAVMATRLEKLTYEKWI